LDKRQQVTLCEQYGYWSGNGYEINNNLWGRDSATSGWQCSYLDGSSDSGIQWHTTWEWQGGQHDVKSYVYSGKQFPRGQRITSINSMQTSVSWYYDTTNVRANVAYDIFTAADPNHVNSSGDYELMIWLAKYGDVQPIGSPVGTVHVNGRNWELWIGMNGNMKVFSFIAPSPLNSWSGEVKEFFNYLQYNQGYPAGDQHLIVFQMGTEAFTGGPATMTVSHFSANIY
uniref:Glycoside hydrolase family 12 beta-1,3-1,4-glucanase n=1 Tax=Chaetomium sp. TaxID=1769349 RepID=A0A915Q9D1_9PEZI|nr:Chain A, glycoside hydrolase family 12 beta-1,3-1,4-glucanase [Chaetomium sp.]7EEE_A Chain A, glycoside hydrolase family 12 beta-1,3-1,4-glucanase [Chaetomium sp.]7EEJ_A Chain A, glycoside hydrolase family 12 beta-1,3-1,4-glucanase [Chaetomium sp.]